MTEPFDICRDFGKLNVNERLNYVLGQVLGVRDFQQEQVYFLHKSRLQNRSLHGYGTVWGLEVQTGLTDDVLEIQVQPGLAIDTQGREVLVDALQCAPLNAWLEGAAPDDPTISNRDTLQPVSDSDSRLAVYVVLCYRSCKTEEQPILGDPCRADTGEDGAIQFIRIRDDFELQLWSQRPLQLEEDHIQEMGDLLAKVIIDLETDPLGDGELAETLQTLKDAIDDPNRIPGLAEITLPGNQSRAILRDLFRYWVTNTRPTLDKLHDPVRRLLDKISIDPDPTTEPLNETELAAHIATFTQALDNELEKKDGDPSPIDTLDPISIAGESATRLRRAVLRHWRTKPQSCDPAEDECILLAELRLPASGPVSEGDVEIQNMQRPYLLHTRLLQELLLQGGVRGPKGEAGETGDPGDAATITVGSVTTGTPASVTNSGTETEAVFDFVLPQGEDGSAATVAVGTVTTGTPASVTNSGTPTEAVLDFVLPQGEDGQAATIAIGSVTTGTPGSDAGVTNVGTPTNAVLDFVIPRGEPGQSAGQGLNQLIIRPNDMLPYNDSENPSLVANADVANGYPVLEFNPTQGTATFSTARPSSAPGANTPTVFLRLYCATPFDRRENPKGVTWNVSWRWVRGIGPIAADSPFDEPSDIRKDTPDPNSNETVLLPVDGNSGFNTGKLPMKMFGLDETPLHLNVSEPLTMKPNLETADYLVVYLELSDIDRPVYLLMAELRWDT